MRKHDCGTLLEVPCKHIRFSQQTCSGRFGDGRRLGQLIDAVVRDPALPLKDERLIFFAVQRPDSTGRSILQSVDNRRLFCFQEARLPNSN